MKGKTESDTALPTVVGVDIGKEVFHLVGLGTDGKITFRKKIRREPRIIPVLQVPATLGLPFLRVPGRPCAKLTNHSISGGTSASC